MMMMMMMMCLCVYICVCMCMIHRSKPSSPVAAVAAAVPLTDVAGAAKTSVMLQAGWPLISALLPQV
jgi:hypothetical protein